MGSPDPIDALAIGVAADHTAKKQSRAKKGAAQEAGAEAKAEAVAAGSSPDEAQALATVVEDKVEGAVEAQPEPTTEAAPEAPAVPPAPGDDAASVFDRRLARLTTLVMDAEFETGTAFGDLRDCILDLYKHRPKLWSAMIPSEQTELIRHIEAMARDILAKVVLVVAQEEDDHIQGTLDKKWTVNGEAIELKVKLDNIDNDVLADVLKLSAHKVVIISADSKRFMSARRVQDPGTDQADLPFASGPAPAAPRVIETPPHPADDSDLVDAADGDPQPQASGDDWGVFDTDRKEWLMNEQGGDDGWTVNSADAGRFTHDKAKELAADFADGGEGVVARQLGDDPAPAQAEPEADQAE